MFYLNVLDIPPKPTEAETKGQSYLQMSIRSRIKFFFRPALAMDIADAPQQVKWTLNGETLTATNPTPYHITFSNVEAIGQAEPASVEQIGMVKPFDTLDFSIKNAQGAKTSNGKSSMIMAAIKMAKRHYNNLPSVVVIAQCGRISPTTKAAFIAPCLVRV